MDFLADLVLRRIDWVNVAGLAIPWVTVVWLDRRARSAAAPTLAATRRQ
jgi:hypothetical protein